jgi:hypothetical protein
MRHVRVWAATLSTLILAAACTDAPTTPGDPHAVGTAAASRDLIMDPIIVIGDPSECDPYSSLDWCEGEGGGTCLTSVPGGDDPLAPALGDFEITTSGCTGGGTGSGSTGGGIGGTGTTSPNPYAPKDEFAEGPLLWAACVLAFVGGVVSVDDVADKFGGWWDAQQYLQRAQRNLELAQSAGTSVDPGVLEAYVLRRDLAIQRRDDAVGAVEDATGVSILTLIAAGVACGAAAVAPTP